MTPDEFKNAVEEFVHMYCEEYTDEHSVKFFDDDEEPRATIRLETHGGEKWDIPICLNETWDEPAIDIGDAGWLPLDVANYYVYLWVEARSRLGRAKDQLVTIAQAEELRKEKEAAKHAS